MKSIDDHIRDALQAEEHDQRHEDEDWQAHLESLKMLFRGRTKWLSIFHVVLMCAFVTMIVFCAVQFFRVDEVRAMIAWASGFIAFIVLQGLAEIYFFMEWNKYVVRWEIKRLELEIASLAIEVRGRHEQRDASARQSRSGVGHDA
jgi:hypothetical protein